jgi:hypothetical protein
MMQLLCTINIKYKLINNENYGWRQHADYVTHANQNDLGYVVFRYVDSCISL